MNNPQSLPELGLIGKIRLKMNEWLREPLGNPSTPDNTQTELNIPGKSLDASKHLKVLPGGRQNIRNKRG